MRQASNTVFENMEYGDLSRLIEPVLQIDTYQSKMGDDSDICVLAVEVKNKNPAQDLVAFIERGYDWVLDADLSSGENEDSNYCVFVEVSRTKLLPEQIIELLTDMLNLTKHSLEDWTFQYYKSEKKHELTREKLKRVIILSPQLYRKRNHSDTKDLDQLKSAAGVDVSTTAPVNDLTEALRTAAGIPHRL